MTTQYEDRTETSPDLCLARLKEAPSRERQLLKVFKQEINYLWQNASEKTDDQSVPWFCRSFWVSVPFFQGIHVWLY